MAGSTIRMAAIDKMVNDIRYKAQILARTNKVESAISGNALLGFTVGAALSLVLILAPFLIGLLGGM